MTKIVKSYYKLISNFQEDLKGTFLFRMKRRQRTLNLLAWRFLLNKVKPVRMDDLLLPRLRRRTVNSRFTIQLRKLRYFYGFYKGYKSVFFKRLHAAIKHYKFNRLSYLAALLELRLDVLLVRLRFFKNIYRARAYIKEFGVVVNGKIIHCFTKTLKQGEWLTVRPEHVILFKYKLLLLLKPTSSVLDLARTNKALAVALTNVNFDLELSLLTPYVRALYGARVRGNRSVFFQTYFPRYLEVNFSAFVFKYERPIQPFLDISYPFKIGSAEAKQLMEAMF